MPASPWVQVASPDADGEYLVLGTYLPLERFRAVPKLFAYSRSVKRQLGRSPGLIGYSLRAAPWRKDFWTLSVWEDEQSLAEFVRTDPHGRIMTALGPQMGATRFVRGLLSG